MVPDGGLVGDLAGVPGAPLLAGVLAGAPVGAEVATAGVTRGAVCGAGGDFSRLTWTTLRIGIANVRFDQRGHWRTLLDQCVGALLKT